MTTKAGSAEHRLWLLNQLHECVRWEVVPAIHADGERENIGSSWQMAAVLGDKGHPQPGGQLGPGVGAPLADVAPDAASVPPRARLGGRKLPAMISPQRPRHSAQTGELAQRRIGKLARPKRIIWADDVPKTRSGKIMRRLLRDIAEGRDPGGASTLRDASVLAKLQQATAEGQ